MLNVIKLLANSFVIESDLDYHDKKELLKFICESSDIEEVKSFILDGSPITISDKDTRQIINKRFDNLIEEIIQIIEQNKPEEEAPKKKGFPISPGNLLYAFYLPASIRAGILAKIKYTLATGGGYLGGVTLAALIGFIAYKVYQNYLSKAAQSCKNDVDKKTCIENFRKKAKLQRIQQLQKGLGMCAKSKNPDKCRKSIVNKINKLKSEL